LYNVLSSKGFTPLNNGGESILGILGILLTSDLYCSDVFRLEFIMFSAEKSAELIILLCLL
jgi:hypothetical protein